MTDLEYVSVLLLGLGALWSLPACVLAQASPEGFHKRGGVWVDVLGVWFVVGFVVIAAGVLGVWGSFFLRLLSRLFGVLGWGG